MAQARYGCGYDDLRPIILIRCSTDHNSLQPCGPIFGPRINESIEPLPTDGAKPTPLPINEDDEEDEDGDDSVVRRWLEPGKIGEEYSGCYSCPGAVKNETCRLVTVYEFNQTVVSQCVDTISTPRGPWVVSFLPRNNELSSL